MGWRDIRRDGGVGGDYFCCVLWVVLLPLWLRVAFAGQFCHGSFPFLSRVTSCSFPPSGLVGFCCVCDGVVYDERFSRVASAILRFFGEDSREGGGSLFEVVCAFLACAQFFPCLVFLCLFVASSFFVDCFVSTFGLGAGGHFALGRLTIHWSLFWSSEG